VSKPGGLRAVATLEATKGIVVLVAGFGTLELLHVGAQHVIDEIVRHLHLNPANRYPKIFLHLADEATTARLWMLALGAMAYSLVRFVESYGLWRERLWAEWFSIISGLIYVPFELVELAKGVTWMRLAFLAINLLVVGYVLFVLKSRSRPV